MMNSRTKVYISILLIIAIMIPMTACGSKTEESSDDGPVAASHMAYVPEEIQLPAWLSSIESWDSLGDTIYFSGRGTDSGLILGSYDSIENTFNELTLSGTDISDYQGINISLSKNTLWLMLKKGKSFAVLCTDLKGEKPVLNPVEFEIKIDSGQSNPAVFSLLALSDNRALMSSHDYKYIIDSDTALIDEPVLDFSGKIYHMRRNDELYILFRNGFSLYNVETESFENPLPIREKASSASNAGIYLNTIGDSLYSYDAATFGKKEIFKWEDVALCSDDIGNKDVFQNSNEEFFYINGRIVKLNLKELGEKKILKLVSFIDTNTDPTNYQSKGFSYTEELMDAIIRFNNTDPEYRVETDLRKYSDDAGLTRLLMELATQEDADIVDTSILPENSLEEGILLDMLPYLDSDSELNRDDFIAPLFQAMLKHGALYEYTSKFALLSMYTRPEQFNDRESWTVDEILHQVAVMPEFSSMSREELLNGFILASTAEFIDWDEYKCSFESAEFKDWLELLNNIPETREAYANAPLFCMTSDMCNSMIWARNILQSRDYVICGFPESKGTGSYFAKLTNPYDAEFQTLGYNTRIGIMASSKNPEAAWRFVKALILSGSSDSIAEGIPVLRKSFDYLTGPEAAKGYAAKNVEISLNDLNNLRATVYNTDKIVCEDNALLDILFSETEKYFGGVNSLDKTAANLQSRVSIYLSEQG